MEDSTKPNWKIWKFPNGTWVEQDNLSSYYHFINHTEKYADVDGLYIFLEYEPY